MEIEYKGGNSVIITTKKVTVVVDPKLSKIGLKDVVVKDAIQLATTEDQIVDVPQRLVIAGPGEYEIADLSLKGIAAVRHIDNSDDKKTTMYTLDNGDTRVGIIGHINATLSEQQLEDLGTLDVLVIPVGGGGYTLDVLEAISLVRQIAPKVVIPVHYADNALKYEVPQGEVASFVKDMGAVHEVVSKFKIKNGILPETLTVVEVTRTS